MVNKKSNKNDSRSPLLKIILSGDSSLSLNLIDMSKRGEPKIFQNVYLNNCVIFKYPNFDIDHMNSNPMTPIGGDEVDFDVSKPLDTAIYIPKDHRDLSQGGSAIYIKQNDFDALMNDAFGIKTDLDAKDIQNDISILNIIDQVPSLDPYLLRSVLTSYGCKLPDEIFRSSDQEDRLIRLRIETKIAPILVRAVQTEGSGDLSIAQKQRFLKVLWNPDLPEAEIFVNSFGIEASQTSAIFTAWKGITYYQIQFEEIAPSLRKVFNYLSGNHLKALDNRMYSSNDNEILKYKASNCLSKIRQAVDECRKIFKSYDMAYEDFVNKNDPQNLRRFLMGAHQDYWQLGYSIIACKHSFERIGQYTSLNQPRSLRYDTIEKMLDEISIIFGRGDGKQTLDKEQPLI
ncbi:hypothetical protein [Oceanibaculum nanhaiense]|uniref:hypothetical protein n=1 Tax=Oceanibaculum nanhaiense TaxID=1909734 RepID=UPI003F71EA15